MRKKNNLAKKIRWIALAIVVLLVIFSTACQMNWAGDPSSSTQAPESSGVPSETGKPTTDPDVSYTDEEVTMVVTKETIAQLSLYPNLKKANLTGSTYYEEILSFAQVNPKIEVIYTVSLGNKEVGNTVSYLSLTDSDFTLDTLKANLKYLPKVTSVALNQTKLTETQINSLKTAYSQIVFTVTAYNSSTVPSTPVDPVITDTKVTVDSTWPVYDWSGRGAGEVEASCQEAKTLTTPCVVKLSSSLSKAAEHQ